MFKKVDATRLDVCIAYACGLYLMYAVGVMAYGLGKNAGKKEIVNHIQNNYPFGGVESEKES